MKLQRQTAARHINIKDQYLNSSVHREREEPSWREDNVLQVEWRLETVSISDRADEPKARLVCLVPEEAQLSNIQWIAGCG